MLKPSTQLDIKDTKLRGNHCDTSERQRKFLNYFMRLLFHSQWCRTPSPIKRLFTTSVWRNYIQSAPRSGKQSSSSYSHSYSTGYFFRYSSISASFSLFAFLFAILSLPIQLYTALFRQHGSDILRAKLRSILVYPGLFWFGYNLSLVEPLLQKKNSGSSKSTFAPVVQIHYHFIQTHWPEHATTSNKAYGSGTSIFVPLVQTLLPLSTNPVARANHRFKQAHWLKQTTTSNQPLPQAKQPDQTRPDHIPAEQTSTIYTAAIWSSFCSRRTGILHLISAGNTIHFL